MTFFGEPDITYKRRRRSATRSPLFAYDQYILAQAKKWARELIHRHLLSKITIVPGYSKKMSDKTMLKKLGFNVEESDVSQWWTLEDVKNAMIEFDEDNEFDQQLVTWHVNAADKFNKQETKKHEKLYGKNEVSDIDVSEIESQIGMRSNLKKKNHNRFDKLKV